MADDRKPTETPKDADGKSDTDALRTGARPGGLTKTGPDSQDNLTKKRTGG